MHPPIEIDVTPGTTNPEYEILLGGKEAVLGADYTMTAELRNGVFIIRIFPILKIVVVETVEKEKHYHRFDGKSWTLDDDGKDKEKKPPVKIEFAEEAPTIDDFGTNSALSEDRIKKWVQEERNAMSFLKRPDGKIKVTATIKDVGPQLKTKLEMFLLEKCPGYSIHETVTINREYFIIVSETRADKKGTTEPVPAPTARNAEMDGVLKFLSTDPEIKMLLDRFSINVIPEPGVPGTPSGRIMLKASAVHAKEVIEIAESVATGNIVAVTFNEPFTCLLAIKEELSPEGRKPVVPIPVDKRHENDTRKHVEKE